MRLKDQESLICNEFTANSFVPLHTPLQGLIQEAALYLSSPAVADTTFCTYVANTGAGKPPNSPAPLLWLGQISFQEKPNPTYHSWLLKMPLSAALATTQQRFPKGQQRHNTYSQKQLFSSCMLLWGLLPVVQAGASEPQLITVITSWFCFCEPPFPYQLLKKPLAIYCQACFEIGLFNQEVNILYYCRFRVIIILILF